MGLNVGGIYVEANGGITQQVVAEAIRIYWEERGAKPSAKDPLDFSPLELKKTGELALLVAPPLSHALDESQWIAVYDSERYTADGTLANHLAQALNTRVYIYGMHDATNQADARYHNPDSKVQARDVEEETAPFPLSFLYFNKLRDEQAADGLASFSFLAFENIPHQPGKTYSGPSPEQLTSNELTARARKLAAARDADGLLALGGDHQVAFDVICAAVKEADLTVQWDLEFAHALCPFVIELSKSHCRVQILEVGTRTGDLALLDRVTPHLASYQAGLAEARAFELLQEGDMGTALGMLVAVTRSGEASLTAWNNAVHAYDAAFAGPGLPGDRLDALLEGAERNGPADPHVFHNLACVYVRRGEPDRALTAVENAVKYGYPMLDRLRDDTDLDSLRSDPRFDAAFSPKNTVQSISHLTVTRGKHTLLAPAVGLHLTFAHGFQPGPAIADVLAGVQKEFPEMFGYYRPSGVCGMDPVRKGKVTRDLNSLRKMNARYGYDIQYDDARGHATELRVQVVLGKNHPGSLLLHLPLSLADDAEALFERMVGYARRLPFASGHAGFALTTFCEGRVVGPTTDAEAELARLAVDFLGLGLSSTQLGRFADDKVSPGWVTFLGKDLSSRVNLDGLNVTALDNGAQVVRASASPFFGVAGDGSDAGDLLQVVRALADVLPTPSTVDGERWRDFLKASV